MFLLLVILASGYVLIQHKGIQNRITDYIMTVVSENLNTDFTVEHVDLAFPYRLRLRNIYLEDLHGDTLLYANSVTLGIRKINPIKKGIKINAVNLNEAYVRLSSDSTSLLNIRFILDRLQSKKEDTFKTGWKIALNNIKLKDSRFSLELYPFKEKPAGINFTDMQLYDVDATLRGFIPGKDSTMFTIKSLSFTEVSGFRLNDLQANFRLSKHFLKFLDLDIKTPVSSLQGKGVQLLFNNWQDFKEGGVYDNVNLLVELKHSAINLSDLGYFAPVFQGTDQVVLFSGRSKGPVGNMKIKDIAIEFGNVSVIKGGLNINGLPDTKEAFIIADFKEFRTVGEDIASFHLPHNRKLQLPDQLNKLGIISYKGKFTGFLNDFVAFGTFKTDLGMLSSDLLFRPDTSNYFSFNGKINAFDFDLGSLLDMQKTIGHLTMSVTARGYSSIRDLKADIKGEINSFTLKNYQYKNIQLSGTIFNKTYNGSLYVNDPNINLDFHGMVDFTKEKASYNFSANLTRANLYALNINKSDPDFNVSFYIEADATGNNFVDLNGEIRLLNSLFEKKDMQLQVYDFSIKSSSQSGHQSLHLRSDFVEADLTGNYDLSKTRLFFTKLLGSYLPALTDTINLDVYRFDHSFDLSVLFKNTEPIFDFFLPDYFINESTTLNASFDSRTKTLFMFCSSPLVKIKNLAWNDYHLLVKGDTNRIDVESGGLNMVINDQIELDNFTVTSNANKDSVDFLARWNNWEEIAYKGSIKANLLFSKQPGSSHPHIAVNILPTTVVTYDTIWKINQCKAYIDSNNVIVDGFSISHNRELFTLKGKISSDPADQINLDFKNFNLGNLNIITNAKGFEIEGMLNGNASFSSLFSNPLVVSNLKIDSLIINKEKLGTADILSTWNNKKRSLEIQAYALRDKLKTVNIQGNYFLNSRELDFTIKLNKLRLNPFNPYLSRLVEDIRGMATGELMLDGTIDKPVLNGEVNLQKAVFTVKYLQSRYNFSERVKIINNNVFFSNMHVFDAYGNKAVVTGSLRNRYFRDLKFDLSIQAKELLFLNTRSTDNKLFYGTAFATGLVNIKGSPSDVDMEISARTEKNTVFNIPLNKEGELSEYNFVTLVHEDVDTDEDIIENKYKVDLSGIRMNFDLEVTPDAEVQIIFDPKVGDILKGSGSGNLNMKISTSGNFIMFGDFTIDKGDYLFTLQNVINKKFTINPGGWIRWNGDPFDASIDLLAKYRTKASLSDLFGSDEMVYKNKIPVDCQLLMTGKLMTPTIRFNVDLPQAEEEIQLRVKNKINTSEEIDKQVISLLMLNSFYYNPGSAGSAGGSFTSTPYSNAAGTTVSELLSNQLSNWLSQISNDIDIGINYRSDTREKGEEVEVMLGTQLFNDRLTINGSVDVSTNAAANASNNIVGEFDIDYKLTKNGRLRVKTYNHINNELLIENSPYTQGLGFTYKEEFNTLGELWRHYWRAISGKKEENQTEIKEESNR
ncbi:MAG: translocation/assembly module TamB domain-containing protein [Bacteroidales bacterium]|nr:translocation/assembly module TamB domain-containing protein [Bacteroidales bacterium]